MVTYHCLKMYVFIINHSEVINIKL
jgi:hypothetical protein